MTGSGSAGNALQKYHADCGGKMGNAGNTLRARNLAHKSVPSSAAVNAQLIF